MLDRLHEIETILPVLLVPEERHNWNSLWIDYERPYVERIWRQHFDLRICLHRIHPCRPGEALLHPHPWPSAVRVLEGGPYEMSCSRNHDPDHDPIISHTLIVTGTMEYQMVNPASWHSVRPIDKPVLSLMVMGERFRQPVDAPRFHPEKQLGPLDDDRFDALWRRFRGYY